MKIVGPGTNIILLGCFRELDDIEAITGLLSEDQLGSRILHWKERDGRLKIAELRFRSARERFSVG